MFDVKHSFVIINSLGEVVEFALELENVTMFLSIFELPNVEVDFVLFSIPLTFLFDMNFQDTSAIWHWFQVGYRVIAFTSVENLLNILFHLVSLDCAHKLCHIMSLPHFSALII